MCCGVDGPENWQGKQIPSSCCREKINTVEIVSATCSIYQTGKNYLSSDGCYDKIKMKIESNTKCLIGVGIGIAFIEVLQT